MLGLFRSKSQQDAPGAAIPVASLADAFAAEMEADADVYRRHYRSVQVRSFPDPGTLMEAFRGIDLLHLFANIDVNGQLGTATGERLKASVLLDVCVSSNVKVVTIASANDSSAHVNGVPAKPLNLVMTIDRKGKSFPEFLDRICGLLVTGSTLPAAWAKIAPQVLGAPHDNFPGCIFHAGKPKALLPR